jgi:hypothetical protein
MNSRMPRLTSWICRRPGDYIALKLRLSVISRNGSTPAYCMLIPHRSNGRDSLMLLMESLPKSLLPDLTFITLARAKSFRSVMPLASTARITRIVVILHPVTEFPLGNIQEDKCLKVFAVFYCSGVNLKWTFGTGRWRALGNVWELAPVYHWVTFRLSPSTCPINHSLYSELASLVLSDKAHLGFDPNMKLEFFGEYHAQSDSLTLRKASIGTVSEESKVVHELTHAAVEDRPQEGPARATILRDLQRTRTGQVGVHSNLSPSVRYCLTEKLPCRVAAELSPTQTSKSEGSTTEPVFAALQ